MTSAMQEAPSPLVPTPQSSPTPAAETQQIALAQATPPQASPLCNTKGGKGSQTSTLLPRSKGKGSKGKGSKAAPSGPEPQAGAADPMYTDGTYWKLLGASLSVHVFACACVGCLACGCGCACVASCA